MENKTIVLSEGKIILNYSDVRKAVLVLRAINHKLRQKIIKVLESEESMTVTQLFIKMRLEQSVLSQHLAILRRAKIVNADRQGKFIFYSLNKERMEQISTLSEDLAG